MQAVLELEPELYREVEREASRQSLSVNAFVVGVLRDRVDFSNGLRLPSIGQPTDPPLTSERVYELELLADLSDFLVTSGQPARDHL